MIKCYEQERTGTHHIPRARPAYVSQEKNALVPDKAVGIIKRTLASCESVKRSGSGSFCHERRSVTVVLSHTFEKIHHLQRYNTNLICPVPDEIVYNLLASA